MCLVVLQTDVHASFGGNPGPAALAVLRSIGGISHEQNRTFCSAFHPLFQKELGVPQENAFIFFEDFAKHNVGHASKTRADA
ncbi:MAG: Tautomerase/MIF superfamily [Olpidium bornovanus]|uniref:L-dopachrome isomerase n=1 Tax=Olpidium bornovanus TaxID=278681 RepID=A0A8H7ZSD6_9FUNG|nr:MAG: Tautomerase/MIF superfamily [Olpidium bornovanus]